MYKNKEFVNQVGKKDYHYKIIVFDEVYILYHFNIILTTTGCPLLKL